MKPVLLLLTAFLLTACGPAPTPVVTPTLPPTATPTPTATPIPPTATITSTPTPSFPADIAAVLEGQDYQIIAGDKIVAANGDTLFRWVPEADRYDPTIEWQRYITFDLEGGGTMEMPRTEISEEAHNYMLKNGIDWGEFRIEKNPDVANFFQNKFFKILGEVGPKHSGGLFLVNNESLRSHIMVYNALNGAIIVYQAKGTLVAIYINENVSIVWSWFDNLRRKK